jgi:Xaa-Pro aminopeptidase
MSEISGSSRVDRLAGALAGMDVDALLLDSLVNVRYLTGFTGSSAAALVFGEKLKAELGPHRFFTDFRYVTQSAAQVPDAFARETLSGDMFEGILGGLSGTSGRLGFEEASVTFKTHRRLQDLLPEGWELIPCAGAVERLRAVKDAGEVKKLAAACKLAEEALQGVLEGGLADRSELDVAVDLELRMRSLGAQAASFPSIVASGAHGALPHAEPRRETIAENVLVTIDWGAYLDGYCSDCTRTYATGEGVSEQAREVYALVLDAQLQSLAAVRAGIDGKAVDAVARDLIEAAGHGEHFGHGLGHGVGMEIHEGPRLSKLAPEDPLVDGNIVTVEPGVYLPGVLGVRIEDLAVVRQDGHEVLTSLPKELTVIS